jgi:hypothetical protein
MMRVATIAALVHVILCREAIVISRYRLALGLPAEISTTRPSGSVTDVRNINGLPFLAGMNFTGDTVILSPW